MKMVWFEELGFDENPFDTGLSISAEKSVGLEKPLEELLYFVNSGSMAYIEGQPGSGKSVLLKKISEKLGRRAVIVDAEKDNIRMIIRKKSSFFEKLFGSNPRRLVLLVDNSDSLSPEAAEIIKFYYDNNHVESAVFTGSSLKNSGIPAAILDRIGNRIIHLAPLTEEEAVAMVRNRIGFSNVLDDDVIRKIYRMSGKSGTRFLQLCEEASKSAVSVKSSTIKEEHLAALRNSVGGIDG
jgi:Cdc6-like AAA superfamily ATPase